MKTESAILTALGGLLLWKWMQGEYDRQIEQAAQNVLQIERDLKTKVNDLARRGASESQIQNITAGQEAALRRARLDYQNLLLAKGKVMEAASREMSLFGIRRRQRIGLVY